MSLFRRYRNFLQKPQCDQISELRKWSDSFSLSPALSQTKPSPAVSVQAASSGTDVCEEAETAAVVNDFGEERKEVDDDVFASSEVEQLFDEREDDDVFASSEVGQQLNKFGDERKDEDNEAFASVEEDQQLASQIAQKEEELLDIWEHGPAQLTMSQDVRIAYLEEKLEKAHEDNKKAYEDNKYLEALLEVREAMEGLICAQKQLAKSTIALLSKQRKTKMASPH